MFTVECQVFPILDLQKITATYFWLEESHPYSDCVRGGNASRWRPLAVGYFDPLPPKLYKTIPVPLIELALVVRSAQRL